MTVPFVAKRRKLTGSFGDRVKVLLEEQGRSVTWLADRIGLHRTSTSRLVNDQVGDPSVSVVKKIADALGVSVGELLDD